MTVFKQRNNKQAFIVEQLTLRIRSGNMSNLNEKDGHLCRSILVILLINCGE